MSTNTPSVETQAYQLAFDGQLFQLEALYKDYKPSGQNFQYFMNMAIIGGSNGKQKNTQSWAFQQNSSSLLWSIEQDQPLWKNVSQDKNRKLSMLRGPGEVAKGTFKGL